MQLRIESLSFGGKGVGNIDGKTVFVKDGVPGDLVEIQIIKDKKKFSEAVIEKIIEPSNHRVEPVCMYFDKCGGCQWQNVNYETQLTAKEDILRNSLERIGGLKDFTLEPIQPSEMQYGYRNKVVLSMWKENKKIHLGYNEENSSEKVSIDNCPVADAKVNSFIEDALSFLQNIEFENNKTTKAVISSGIENTCLTIQEKNIDEKIIEIKAKTGKSLACSLSKETNEFNFQILGYKFISLPSVFNQANYYINEKIVEHVLNFAKTFKPKYVLDLYCGIGNFSLPFSSLAEKVDGVDSDRKAIRLAKRNARINEIKNVRFHNEKVENSLRRPQKKQYDIVLLDPPRSGAKNVIKTLIKLKPQCVIYISCDPATLSRDIKEMTLEGYKVISVKPFDMFPQTYHIETVVILSYDTNK